MPGAICAAGRVWGRTFVGRSGAASLGREPRTPVAARRTNAHRGRSQAFSPGARLAGLAGAAKGPSIPRGAADLRAQEADLRW